MFAMDSPHYIQKCRHCDTVIAQCRCASPHKHLVTGTCAACAASTGDVATLPIPVAHRGGELTGLAQTDQGRLGFKAVRASQPGTVALSFRVPVDTVHLSVDDLRTLLTFLTPQDWQH